MATVELTKDTFDSVVTDNGTVIVDFWAPWCGPCKAFAPAFERASDNHADVVFGKVNTDDEGELAQHFGIRSIPTLMVFRDQIMVFQQAGALPPQALEEVLRKCKALDMDEVRREVAARDEANPS
jgi:thioredoxin 1